MADFIREVPDGDNRERAVCRDCGHIDYQNPKIVAGAVVVHDGKILLCRRAIEPRRDYWTLPAGYMELGETVEEGARREALEEAEADITLEGILAIYSISRIGQVQFMFRARFTDAPVFSAGVESLEVGLFAWMISRGTGSHSRRFAGRWRHGGPILPESLARRWATRPLTRAAPGDQTRHESPDRSAFSDADRVRPDVGGRNG